MFPWLWFWSPTLHLPFSGSVAQQIEPDTQWFFAGIPPGAGNGQIEKKAFDVASEAVKEQGRAELAEAARAALGRLRQADPTAYQSLLASAALEPPVPRAPRRLPR